MNFYINKFSILSPIKRKAFTQEFKNNINLIIGEKDSGKTTLVRAMLYTLGCDVRNFSFLTEMPSNIYIIEFTIDAIKYMIIRKRLNNTNGKNYFKVFINGKYFTTYSNTSDFKEFLNKALEINIIINDKNGKETKLFPNHIFLPFYSDQDYSWQKYLIDTFANQNFIKNYNKVVLEYFVGARSNEYYDLILKRNICKKNISEIESTLNSKKNIIEDNESMMKIIENVDFDEFKCQYEEAIKKYNEIINKEHRLKSDLNNMIYTRNYYHQEISQIENTLSKQFDVELNEECPNCKQKIYKDFEDNYKLLLSKENLMAEMEKLDILYQKTCSEIDDYKHQLGNVKYNLSDMKKKLDEDGRNVELSERATSYALGKANIKLNDDIKHLEVGKKQFEEWIDEIEKKLSGLNSKDVAMKYRSFMIGAFKELEINFAYKNYYTSNLESVNIYLSGASKVQAFVAQYISIYKMILSEDTTINIPMILDTFLKDDFNEHEIEITSKFIFNNLQDVFQSFVFISNNASTLKSINDYNYNRIDLRGKANLLSSNYDDVYNKYSKYIEFRD